LTNVTADVPARVCSLPSYVTFIRYDATGGTRDPARRGGAARSAAKSRIRSGFTAGDPNRGTPRIAPWP
jgi:hypothetical protein